MVFGPDAYVLLLRNYGGEHINGARNWHTLLEGGSQAQGVDSHLEKHRTRFLGTLDDILAIMPDTLSLHSLRTSLQQMGELSVNLKGWKDASIVYQVHELYCGLLQGYTGETSDH